MAQQTTRRISIREIAEKPAGWDAAVSFDSGPPATISISNPFSEEEEKELEWYFEEHLEFPFTKKVRAQNAANSITTYGEALFKQVFSNSDVYSDYRELLKSGLNSLQIEIEGSPKFHALHWEALKDPNPKLEQPLALSAILVRKNARRQTLPATVRPSPTINLLLVTARSDSKRDVAYRTISRPLVEMLRNANLHIQVDILRPGTYRALENHLRDITAQHGEGYYHVIHFDMHGSVLTYDQFQAIQQQPAGDPYRYRPYARQAIQRYDGVKAFLAFEPDPDEQQSKEEAQHGQIDLVEASQLANLLTHHHIPIVILNACQSGKQVGERETSLGSYLVQAGMQLVLAMGYSVTVSAAALLMKTLYQHLFAGDDLAVAIRHGRTELYNYKKRHAYFDETIDLEDWLLPVVYQNQPIQLQPRVFTQEERATWFGRKAEEQRYTPPNPSYGFVGRDLDILQIERRLLLKRNLLLVRGMGGAGKTTLLRHLAAWWHTTGFVNKVFYFGYDEKAWTLQQIMTAIAQDLYGPRYYTDFQPLAPAAQQAMLTHDLRATPHLLILDNLESITGAHLAIQHTLPLEEQQALRSFLTDLALEHPAKRGTLVLLGSRGSEDWLAKGTFDDNLYDLPGLDPEAASTLADRILERNQAIRYRKDEDLRKLIQLLDGFPLALEVVLANLARQTPRQVLEALQAGDVQLDIDNKGQPAENIFEQKTRSILHCIDYSHSNLSPEAQQLLLCLAPFTSVIWQDMLDRYTNHLRQQPTLATLPFERWPEVIREAQNWGLLNPDPDIPRFLHLQPIFPYFLRNRLHSTEHSALHSAIETAFREHYDELADAFYALLESKDPQERQLGQLLTGLEYENLVTTLNLALAAQVSILKPYFALFQYLYIIPDPQRGLALSYEVRESLKSYPTEKLEGPLGSEMAHVIDRIAVMQLELKQYAAAEQSYQEELATVLTIKSYNEATSKKLSASIFHNLGIVAQQQRQWLQAEQYYQQALQIDIEFNDRYEQASTYHQLGSVAQEQRQWLHAERYFQQALQICIEFNDQYHQALIYHQLGIVAQEQRQWQQAEQYYQQALQIYIQFNDRYAQAGTYHELGMVAEEQRQWQQAEQYYQQALQLKIEYNDRHKQASTYHQLGRVAEEQRQWLQARDYYLRALEIFVGYKDAYSGNVVLRSLARLWQASNDAQLPAAVAETLGGSVEETEKLLRKMLE